MAIPHAAFWQLGSAAIPYVVRSTIGLLNDSQAFVVDYYHIVVVIKHVIIIIIITQNLSLFITARCSSA